MAKSALINVKRAACGDSVDRTRRSKRIKVTTRFEHRRGWTAEQKREIALASLALGTSATEVARKHKINTAQRYTLYIAEAAGEQ